MTSRRSEGHLLLWVSLAFGGGLLALLLLGGGVATLWALGYLGPRRNADAAGAKPGFTGHGLPRAGGAPALPALPVDNPFANPARGRLTAANCEGLKPGL